MHSPAAGAVLAGPTVGAARFQYHRARSADEVDTLLATLDREARILAGGTDLIVQIRAGVRQPRHVIDVADVAELSRIDRQHNRFRIGAAVPMCDLRESAELSRSFAALMQGCQNVGSLQIQSRATLAGNACNASPAADTSPALLVYGAVMGIRSVHGAREVAIADFWTGPGRTVLRPGEWVEHVTLTDPGVHGSSYVKLGRTRGVDLAVVGIACAVTDDAVRFACASMAPTARRIGALERLLADEPDASAGAIDTAIAAELTPISDVRAGARYRLAMAGVCARRAYAAARAQRRALSDES